MSVPSILLIPVVELLRVRDWLKHSTVLVALFGLLMNANRCTQYFAHISRADDTAEELSNISTHQLGAMSSPVCIREILNYVWFR